MKSFINALNAQRMTLNGRVPAFRPRNKEAESMNDYLRRKRIAHEIKEVAKLFENNKKSK